MSGDTEITIRPKVPISRLLFLAGYSMSRDVRQVAHIHRAADMQRLLRILAANAACLHNTDSFASALSVPATTVREYVRILETIFIVRMVPGTAQSVVLRHSLENLATR